MSDDETITVADVSAGPGGAPDTAAGTPVELPVVDILTGRGFVTGKSGSGKSNTVSVMLENLLDKNFPVLVVDSDGEYYGLKEEYEVLHVGADDECDIQVTADHAEKIASLALEENIPIILDVSGYLDDDDADELVLETTRHLFAKEKKLKKPFLVVVEECHEYIPEQSGMGEAGKMLIKIGKRGRKHGLGIVGISQRPADVKKDFITQCDWLVWHRLTWRNDTKVVGRILGSEYAEAIEEMGDGEGFLVADWASDIQRVQFHRKRTFDAGATPGLEDFERPELKSVSGDLVSELTEISDEKERRESKIADLQQELDKKEAEIQQLEQELEEARDLSRMADQFAQALLQRSEAPHRGGRGRNLDRPDEQADIADYQPEASTDDDDPGFDPLIAEAEPDREGSDPTGGPATPAESTAEPPTDPMAALGTETADTAASDDDTTATGDGAADDRAETASGEKIPTDPVEALRSGVFDGPNDGSPFADDGGSTADSAADSGFESPDDEAAFDGSAAGAPVDPTPVDPSQVSGPSEAERTAEADSKFGTVTRQEIAEEAMQFAEAVELGTRDAVVEELRERIEELPEQSVGMLRHYREAGESDPLTAHRAAGGDDDQQLAYSRNRPLRQAQLIRHTGRGRYAYAVPELIEEAYAYQLETNEVDTMVRAIEASFRPSVDDPRDDAPIGGTDDSEDVFGF
ncbi:helicase HerA domain-containing protein [Halohasta salina]|uniref:helicase HerA domain-containing protein n=1 Tax=Halohasta salina TaxID=2961621 RepID=UPI0020A53219|nr:DUF87 domain-containing protein [Halohasta salina]